MTVFLFFAVLFVLILVHEWGHFIVAKKTGMRVDEFGIGFPPKLFGWKKGETEYTLNALPIGGFVRIFGENGEESFSPVASDGRSELSEAGRGGENFDEDERSLSEGDRARAFGARPKWAQALVLIAGVTMNVLFAWFLFTAALLIGVPTSVDEDYQNSDAQLIIASVLPDTPAAEAGIPVGAIVTKLTANDEVLTLPTPQSFKAFIGEYADTSITLTYTKNDQVVSTDITPTLDLVERVDTPAIGVSLTYVATVREPLHRAVYLGAESTVTSLWAITKGLGTFLVSLVVGQADLAQVAGPVGIAGLVGDAAEFGFTSLLLFTAIISLNLAVINLLPVPALDGGRLVFVAIESVTGRTIPVGWAARVNFVGFVLLLVLMLVVTVSDVLKLL